MVRGGHVSNDGEYSYEYWKSLADAGPSYDEREFESCVLYPNS